MQGHDTLWVCDRWCLAGVWYTRHTMLASMTSSWKYSHDRCFLCLTMLASLMSSWKYFHDLCIFCLAPHVNHWRCSHRCLPDMECGIPGLITTAVSVLPDMECGMPGLIASTAISFHSCLYPLILSDVECGQIIARSQVTFSYCVIRPPPIAVTSLGRPEGWPL